VGKSYFEKAKGILEKMYDWEVLSEYDKDKPIVDQLLDSRGIVSREEKDIFLNPPPFNYWFKKLPRELLISLKKARDVIRSAILEDKPIVIHGDYDADGICATAILYKVIKEDLGYDHVYGFIPNRFDHGYGLSEESINASLDMIERDVGNGVLFITVDTGITAVDEVAKVTKMGHSIIVTDHHQKLKELPKAQAVVWYDQVVGATVSYLLAVSLGLKNTDLISYCCLATITDLQPVLDFNRTIVKEGLEIINSNPPIGIKSLLEVAGRKDQEITTGDLGWVVGPRLNASGRIKDPSLALNLLLEEDQEKASEMAWELNQVNAQRQDKTMEMFEIAKDVDEEHIPKIILSHDENYHEGIIGLVASRLAKKYNRPAVVISTSEKVAKGSVRSIKGINIIETLRQVDHLFTSLGGHPMAAGFSIKKEHIPDLNNFLVEFSNKNISQDMLTRKLFVDMSVPADIINEKLLDEIDLLRPYGMGNREPVFVSHGLKVAGVNMVGRENQHLSMKLFDGDNILKAIFFNYGDYLQESIETGDEVDAVYTLKRNDFNGKIYANLILKDIIKSETV